MMHRAFRFQLRINKFTGALLPLVVLILGTTSLPAAVRAVLPGCCSSVATLTAADPKTGLTRNTLTIGPLSSCDVRALDFALSLPTERKRTFYSRSATDPDTSTR